MARHGGLQHTDKTQMSVKRKLWNKCDVCGRIIPYSDFESGAADWKRITPDSLVSVETWVALHPAKYLCRDHNRQAKSDLRPL